MAGLAEVNHRDNTNKPDPCKNMHRNLWGAIICWVYSETSVVYQRGPMVYSSGINLIALRDPRSHPGGGIFFKKRFIGKWFESSSEGPIWFEGRIYYFFFFFFNPSRLLFQFNFHFCLSASLGHTSAWQSYQLNSCFGFTWIIKLVFTWILTP